MQAMHDAVPPEDRFIYRGNIIRRKAFIAWPGECWIQAIGFFAANL